MTISAGIAIYATVHFFRKSDQYDPFIAWVKQRDGIPILTGVAIICSTITGTLGLYFDRKEKIKGFFVYFYIRFDDSALSQRRYVFDSYSSEGSRASFYLSASDLFVFAITAVNGEVFSIEILYGDKSIPIGRFSFLYIDAIIGRDSTSARILIDGKEINRREFSLPIDLGKRKWERTTIGADVNEKNKSSFKIAGFGSGYQPLTESQIDSLNDNLAKYLNTIAFAMPPK